MVLAPYSAIVDCLVYFLTVDNLVGYGGTTLGSWSVPKRIIAHERSELIKNV